MKNGQVSVGALASIWSPSFSVTFFDVTIEVGAEVGAIGAGIDIGKKALKLKEHIRLAHRLAFHGKRPSNS